MLDNNSVNSNDNELNDSKKNQITSPSTSNLVNKLNENLIISEELNGSNGLTNNNLINSNNNSVYTRPIGSEREDLHVSFSHFITFESCNHY